METDFFQQKKYTSIKIVKYVFFTGLIAGTLDISAALINYFIASGSKDPVIVLYFIASGVFGQFAFVGGVFYALCGLTFHFVIAFSFTTFYFYSYPKIKPFIKNKYFTGFLFGIITWLIMNLIVVPLSNTPFIRHSVFDTILGMLFLALFIGFPSVISSDKYFFT